LKWIDGVKRHGYQEGRSKWRRRWIIRVRQRRRALVRNPHFDLDMEEAYLADDGTRDFIAKFRLPAKWRSACKRLIAVWVPKSWSARAPETVGIHEDRTMFAVGSS
jgi:cobalamin biosynthesis Mg chelatase CobN